MGMSASPGVLPVRISGPFYIMTVSGPRHERKRQSTHGVKSNGDGTAGQILDGLTDVIDDGLVVL